jgi:hypothetical protein
LIGERPGRTASGDRLGITLEELTRIQIGRKRMSGNYGMVAQVKIETVDDKTVTFTTRSASKSGDPDERLLRAFTCPISEIYTQPIAGAPLPVPLTPGAEGPLYLSGAGWQITSDDGYQIYGAGTPIAQLKYPDDGAGLEFVGDLTVIPSSIVVRGMLKGGRTFFDFELLGPDTTAAQHILWNGVGYLVVHLTPRGARYLQLPEQTEIAEIWPTKITVTGAPSSDPAVSGSVDVLDSKRASQHQEFAFAVHGEPIRLSLTQAGFAAFHAIPGMPDTAPAHPVAHRR